MKVMRLRFCVHFSEVFSIIKKHLCDVEVDFNKLNKIPGDYDVYPITIFPEVQLLLSTHN